MSDLGRALLAGVCDHPDDDLRRLVYADWLDDHGEPHRAEFIRLQCRIAARDEADPAYQEAKPRLRVLEHLHGDSWQPDVPPSVREQGDCFRRGFVAVLQRGREDFLASPDRYDRFSPIEGLTCHDFEGDGRAEAFAAEPHLARLRSLSVTAGPAGIARLAASRPLRSLAELSLPVNCLDDLALAALEQAEWPRLAALDLSYNREFTWEQLGRLIDSPRLPALRSLDLDHGEVGADGVGGLADRPGLARLARLGLRRNDLGDEGVVRLLRSPHLHTLRSLSLASNRLGDAAAAALAGGHSMTSLVNLLLFDNQITAGGVAALARSRALAGLRHLALSDNRAGPDGARALAASETLTGLVRLSLSSNDLGDEGAIALAAWPGLREVRTLAISSNGITAAGFGALIDSAHLRNLVTLLAGDNPVGDAGAVALARSRLPGRLRHLDLSNCGVGLAGAEALAAAAWSGDLAWLELNNPFDAAGLALARSTTLPAAGAFRLDVLRKASFGPGAKAALAERFGAGLT